MTTDWVKIVTYSTGFEADGARSTLEEAGIPVIVRGNQAGMFGSGFLGPVIGGIEVHVPLAFAEQARELVGFDEEYEERDDDEEEAE